MKIWEEYIGWDKTQRIHETNIYSVFYILDGKTFTRDSHITWKKLYVSLQFKAEYPERVLQLIEIDKKQVLEIHTNFLLKLLKEKIVIPVELVNKIYKTNKPIIKLGDLYGENFI